MSHDNPYPDNVLYSDSDVKRLRRILACMSHDKIQARKHGWPPDAWSVALTNPALVSEECQPLFWAFSDKINLPLLCSKTKLPMRFIRANSHLFCGTLWSLITLHQRLTPEMVSELVSRAGSRPGVLASLCWEQDLTEDFMRAHVEELAWRGVSFRQHMSLQFMKDFEDRLCWDQVFDREAGTVLTPEILWEFRTHLNPIRWSSVLDPHKTHVVSFALALALYLGGHIGLSDLKLWASTAANHAATAALQAARRLFGYEL